MAADFFWQNFLDKIREAKGKSFCGKNVTEQEIPWKNPYLKNFRRIMEQILELQKISYCEFKPVLIDRGQAAAKWQWNSELEEKLFLDEMDEGIQVVLEELSPDLNFLKIFTDRPEYFRNYAGTMYGETGLLVEIQPKKQMNFRTKEIIIDLEQTGFCEPEGWQRAAVYLPVWKKKWETLENLDILVPIGYNTLIVKNLKNEGRNYYPDRIESGFYKD